MPRASGAKVSSTERLSPRLNLRRSTRMGAWDLMSLSEVGNEHINHRNWSGPVGDLSQEIWGRVGQWG